MFLGRAGLAVDLACGDAWLLEMVLHCWEDPEKGPIYIEKVSSALEQAAARFLPESRVKGAILMKYKQGM